MPTVITTGTANSHTIHAVIDGSSGLTKGGSAAVLTLNAKHLYPGPEPVRLPPRYTVIKSTPHPLQFLPYQYEGYRPEQRAALRAADISMRLIIVPRQ